MAGADDYFKEVGLPGSATTLASPGYTIGAGTINVGSTANWPTTTGVTFAIDTGNIVVVNGQNTFVRTPGSYTEYDGVVSSGTSVTGVVLRYGSAQNYPAGATTRVYIPVSSSRENRIVTGLRNVLNDNATLKASAIPDGSVSTSKLVDGNVITSKLADSSISIAKLDLSSLIPCNKEATVLFSSGGIGSFGNNGIGAALDTTFTISTTGVYNVSLLLPSVYSDSTTTQWYIRVKSATNSTTFFENLSGGTGAIAFATSPTTFYVRRRMNLTAGTYPVTFEWYGTVAGAGNPITVGAGVTQPASFKVEAI